MSKRHTSTLDAELRCDDCSDKTVFPNDAKYPELLYTDYMSQFGLGDSDLQYVRDSDGGKSSSIAATTSDLWDIELTMKEMSGNAYPHTESATTTGSVLSAMFDFVAQRSAQGDGDDATRRP